MDRGSGIAIALVLILLAVLPAGRVAGDTSPPTITDTRWEPRYPIHPSNVTLSATVADPDGVSYVEGTWCYFNPYSICLFVPMTDPDGDGVYETVPRSPEGFSTAEAEGAYYSVYAVDAYGNDILTDKIWTVFVDSLDLSLPSGVIEAEPGQPFTVQGTAVYEGNASAPAEGVSVDVGIPGKTGEATVGADGSFSVTLVAPAVESTYPVTVTATDRTLTDAAEVTLAVSLVPRPDLAVAEVRLSTESPLPGQTVAVSFHVQNLGNAPAADARVLVTVVAGESSQAILDETISIPAGGAFVPLVARWTATAGEQMVRISVDPNGDIDEVGANTANNVAELPVTVRPPAESTTLYVWMVVGGAVAAIAVGAVLALRRRRTS